MKKNEVLIGSFSVFNALVAKKRRISEILISDSIHKSPTINQIIELAKENAINIAIKSQRHLDKFSKNEHNQGIVAVVSPLLIESLKGLGRVDDQGYTGIINANLSLNFKLKRNPVWIGLEEIVDPRNLGGILRTCYFFGVDGVVVTSRNSAPINETVSKTSAGALELMDIYTSFNLSKFLKVSKDNGWGIYGTDLRQGRENIDKRKRESGSIIVFGNEGDGLSVGVSKVCDEHLVIKGNHQSNYVDSLNVGVSAGILIHEFMSRM